VDCRSVRRRPSFLRVALLAAAIAAAPVAGAAEDAWIAVRGIVVDEVARPIPGARVRLLAARDGELAAVETASGGDGSFHLETPRAPGSPVLEVEAPGRERRHRMLDETWSSARSIVPTEVDVGLVPLAVERRVVGRLVDGQGAPASGSIELRPEHVLGWSSAWRARAGEGGRFELGGLTDGEMHVWVRAPDGTVLISERKQIQADPGAAVDLGDVVVPAPVACSAGSSTGAGRAWRAFRCAWRFPARSTCPRKSARRRRR